MKQRLCCLLDPLVICIKCLAPSCGTCAKCEKKQHYPTKKCKGIWYPTYHEAITDPKIRRTYLALARLDDN